MAWLGARTGRSPYHLATEVPLHVVLWEYHAMQDVDRLDALARESAEITAGFRLNWAFADPKRLEAERRAFEARLWTRPTGEALPPTVFTADQAARLHALLQQMRAGHRAADDPAPPLPA